MTAGWNAYTGPRTEDMATTTKVGSRKSEIGSKRESKGKQHPVHAESLDKIADDLDAGAIYPTAGAIAKMFRNEAIRVRSILR